MKAEEAPQKSGTTPLVDPPSHSRLLREACTALLSSGQRARFRATGLSMDPTIRDGDILTVEPMDPGEVRPGEILLYRTPRGVVAHRLVRCEKAEAQLVYIFRGDASGTCDPPVSFGEVLGRVIATRRGRRSRSLLNPWIRQWQLAWAAANRLTRVAIRLLSSSSP